MLDARRRACLRAMGIDQWRHNVRDAEGAAPRFAEPIDESPGVEPVAAAQGRTVPAQGRTVQGEPSAAPDGGGGLSDAVASAAQTPAALETVANQGWGELQATVAACRACALHENRTQTVFGVGDLRAPLMVIGEAPGADEDRQGEPFVGRAGQLLNAMLAAIGFERDQVYIANIVKCRPPGNRDPHAEEAAACRDYLARQIELVGPKLILSVGRVSAHNLLGTDEAVGRLRGTVHRLDPGNVPLIVTYHPAYLLRRPQEKAKSWQDLQSAWRLLNDA